MTQQKLAVVVIGRNEGDRLRRCIDTLVQQTAQIVYVDSGSTDDSVATAQSRGVHVLNLDMSRPFSAARARNAGYAIARTKFPQARYVQFVDGDCDVDPHWLVSAVNFLEQRTDVAAVFGRLTERHPERSIYNLQVHLSWNPPSEGETEFFGGNFMARTDGIDRVGGFREDVIGSEDHELAIRLRGTGRKVWYLAQPMATHDLAMYRFSQWWRRSLRSGYGNGHIITLHPDAPGRPRQHAWYRSWFWGLFIPTLILIGTWLYGPIGLTPALLYSISFVRTYFQAPEVGGGHAGHALLLILGKFAEMSGQAKFLLDRWGGREATIIEYK